MEQRHPHRTITPNSADGYDDGTSFSTDDEGPIPFRPVRLKVRSSSVNAVPIQSSLHQLDTIEEDEAVFAESVKELESAEELQHSYPLRFSAPSLSPSA